MMPVCLSWILTLFYCLPLSMPATALCGSSDSRIDLVGSFQVTIHYRIRVLHSFDFHVSQWEANLMGLDLNRTLGVLPFGYKGVCNFDGCHTYFGNINGLCCLRHRDASLPLPTSTLLLIQPLCCIPLMESRHDGVTVKPQQMLDVYITEPV